MRLALAALAALSTITVAHAADDPATDFRKVDERLNESFKQIEQRLADDPDARARLVHAQRTWIAFRDAECTFQSSGDDGGSAAPMVVAVCKATLTSARNAQLEAYLNCEEGDLACPVPGK